MRQRSAEEAAETESESADVGKASAILTDPHMKRDEAAETNILWGFMRAAVNRHGSVCSQSNQRGKEKAWGKRTEHGERMKKKVSPQLNRTASRLRHQLFISCQCVLRLLEKCLSHCEALL